MSTEALEHTLGRLLTLGTRATTVALVLGLAAAFLFPAWPVTPVLLTTGLAILLLTPVARVAVSVLGFVRQRDWLFVLCTAVVLILLIGGFVSALR